MSTARGNEMEQNILASILAIIVYLSTSIFGGGGDHAVSEEIIQPKTERRPSAVVVSAEEVTMRSETAASSPVITVLKKGAALTVTDEENGYYQVTEEKGRKGWVAKWAVQPGYLPSSFPSGAIEVLGYYAESYQGDQRALNSFSSNTKTITMVAPLFYRVDRYGNISGHGNTQLSKMAQANGTKILPMVTNISGANFSRSVVSSMLRSKSARTRAVSGILRLLRENGCSGVNIDFEGVPAQDRAYLTAFFKELASTLRPYNLLVTAALPAKTASNEGSSWSGAYDYQAISPYLDLAVIMSYDQHHASGAPGPVASQGWVDEALKYTLRYFSPNRVLMGLAGYGYDWTKRSGKAVNYQAIQDLIKRYRVAPQWNDEYQTPYFTYTQSGVKHEVWYENRHSAIAKMRLVKKYGLRGVAVWRLGYEDPEIWSAL